MAPWLKILCSLLASILIAGTLLSVLRYDSWWIRAWDFPRAQILIAGLLLIGPLWLLRTPEGRIDLVLISLLGLCLVLQAWRIFPYTPMASVQSVRFQPAASTTEIEQGVSLMLSNVLMENRQSDALVSLVREKDPDLFFAAEVDQWWDEELSVLSDVYPHSLRHPLENTYGMVFYSKLRLVEPEIQFIFEPDTPSMHTKVELDGGALVQLHLLHPRPPFPGESLNTTERDAEILVVGRTVRPNPLPTIVAGDLNDVAWSRTTRLFQRVSGLLDPRVGRGLYSSFHADYPFLRWPLDHVFHSDHFALIDLERLPSIGSDHFPMFVRLRLERTAPVEQESPDLNNGDLEETSEKIEKAEEEAQTDDGAQ